MRNLLGLLLFTCFMLFESKAYSLSLDKFNIDSVNESGNIQLVVSVSDSEGAFLELKTPFTEVMALTWKSAGVIEFDWSYCQSESFLLGNGNLNQCKRRTYLKIGENDNKHIPAKLVIQLVDNKNEGILIRYSKTGFSSLVLASISKKIRNDLPEVDLLKRYRNSIPNIVSSKKFLKSVNDLRKNYIHKNLKPLNFSNVIPEPNTMGFIVVGDAGTGKNRQKELAKGMKEFCDLEKCNFVTYLGDNIYPNGVINVEDELFEKNFEIPFKIVDLKFNVALGNHDHRGDVDAEINYSSISSKWNIPARYYSYGNSNIEFFVLDTDDFDEIQLQWLKDKLSNSSAKWKIVYGHHPILSDGFHGDTRVLKRLLTPLLKANKVQMYLSGHDHNKQIFNEDGIVYLVSGAGAKLRRVSRTNRGLFLSKSYGFAHILIQGDSALVRFLANDGQVQYQYEFARQP